MQIFENKKKITTIIKELRTCFDKINQQFMLWILETTKLKKIKKKKKKKTNMHHHNKRSIKKRKG